MADNYLEKRMERYRAHSQSSSGVKPKDALVSLLVKNRSIRGYDTSYVVRADQLRRIVSVNNKLASARNRQPLRFRLVTADEASNVLPFIGMGAGLKDVKLPIEGYEPNAFIVVCSTIEPHNSTYVDLGISAQSMLLQAVEMGLNGLCIMSFDGEALVEALQLPYKPLLVIAVGKSAEKTKLVDIKADDDHSYYRENGVHYVPKVIVDDLIIE
ncbi:MAG: nitroreductase family protein [Bacteroidaceae bacterium]|nr:nitroreductase family protein [Bacteroidaceae bacterium]